MKKITLFSLICANALALEFIGLGNDSISMGYAGVALKNNDYALYYNPSSIIYTKNGINFTFGANFYQKNLLELSNISKDTNKNIENSVSKIKNIFTISTTRANNDKFGNIDCVIDDFIARNLNSNNEDLNLLANAFNDEKNHNSNSFDDTIISIQDKLLQDKGLNDLIRQELLISTNNTSNELNNLGVDKTLLENIINDYDTSNVLEVIKASKDGNASLDELLLSIGNIDLKTFLDNNTTNDLDLIYNAVYDNEINANIMSAITYNQSLSSNSALSLGVFNGIHINTYAGLNSNKSSLIIKVKDKDEFVYLKLFKIGDKLYASSVSESEYLNNSALQKGVKNPLKATTLMITEVPIAYANSFALPFGELSVGASFKYMNIKAYSINKGIELDINGINSSDLNIRKDLNNARTTNTIGLDFGLLYSYEDFSAGLVLKNINTPKIKFHNNEHIRLNHQIRLGFAYMYDKYTFAFDSDLTSNNTLSTRKPKSQLLGGGIKYNFNDSFNLRGGFAYDLKKDEGLILTTGFNLFNVFDLALASGLKSSKCDKDVCKVSSQIPNYFDLRLAFSYSW